MAKKKSTSVKVDFSGVESFKKMDEGDTLLKVTEVTKEKGEKGDYLAWVLQDEGEARVYHNTSLTKQSLWNLKAWLDALGVEVPDEELDLDLEDMVDKEIMASIELETYNGKKKPKIVDFWSAEGADEDDKKSSKKDKKKAGKEKPDEDAINDMDEDELADVIKTWKLDIDTDDYPKVKKLRAAVIEALEGADDEDAGDKKSSKKDKKGKKPTEEEVDEMDEDDLEKVVEKHELEVDLSKLKTLRKMQAAVKEALEE